MSIHISDYFLLFCVFSAKRQTTLIWMFGVGEFGGSLDTEIALYC